MTTRIAAIAFAISMSACAGKMPQNRYYQLVVPDARPSSASATVALAIEPLETAPAYDDERIVYRLTPYRVDYYNYHRWSSPPGTLITDYLERAFERSGRFHSVTRDASTASVTLSGRVIALEEVDRSKTSWLGRVVVELRLVETSSGTVLWTEQYEETEPLDKQTPEGLARAVSIAMHRIATRALPVISDLATRTAGVEPAKVAPARSARLRP